MTGPLHRPFPRALAVILLVLGVRGAALLADVKPLTLYQKTARASLVVRVRALEGSTRRPPLQVLEVYKGAYKGGILFIVPFAQDYANPKPWLQRESFAKGDEYVLFLTLHEGDSDKAFRETQEEEAREDHAPESLFVCLNASQGVIPIPPEGAPALTEAVKRFVAILALRQHDLQADALRGLLSDRNPYLVEAGLEEVERFDLAQAVDLPTTLSLLGSSREGTRAGALRVISQIVGAARSADHDLRDRREVFTRIVDRAYNDGAASVRKNAVHALAALGGEGVTAVLRAISERDTDQDVRYQAQIELLAHPGRPLLKGDRP